MSQTLSKTNTPLVVDLDGTLTLTDTLVESLIHVIKQSPLNLLRVPLWLLKGRAGFKAIIAEKTWLATESLPYREPLVAYLREEKAQGRRIILATAAHATIADAVARQLGLFDQVLATTPGHNLKGRAKLKAIQENVGSSFVYAGDTQADLPIWQVAKAAILVGAPPALAATVREKTPIEREFPNEKATLTDWLRALRVHQWIKNLLLFVPLLTAFSFMEINKLFSMGLAFLAFSLAASATYIVNDLWDLDSDRLHPRKRLRPFASARLSILHGLAVAGVSLASAFLLAYCVSISFCLMLLAYLALTSAYSWTLKKYVLIDAIMLSLLYTLRILAGAVAIEVATSSWLLAFSVFIFLSLALVKRCAELVSLEKSGLDKAHGRDYRVTDLTVLWPLGVGTALSAVVVFGLFISSPETQTRYATPQLLWLLAIGLVYWLGRLWIKTSRGEMHDDPVVYAIKDDVSRITVAIMLFVMLMAHFFALGS